MVNSRNEIVSWVRSNIRVLNVTANDDAEPILVTTFTEERAPLIFQNSLKQVIPYVIKTIFLSRKCNCGFDISRNFLISYGFLTLKVDQRRSNLHLKRHPKHSDKRSVLYFIVTLLWNNIVFW